VDKARRHLGVLTPEQESALEAATKAIVNKLLHSPMVHLKESAQDGHPPEQLSLIRKLLGL
jgi:glutamyl-tRNA reductase